jgi:hypothetical protein
MKILASALGKVRSEFNAHEMMLLLGSKGQRFSVHMQLHRERYSKLWDTFKIHKFELPAAIVVFVVPKQHGTCKY